MRKLAVFNNTFWFHFVILCNISEKMAGPVEKGVVIYGFRAA